MESDVPIGFFREPHRHPDHYDDDECVQVIDTTPEVKRLCRKLDEQYRNGRQINGLGEDEVNFYVEHFPEGHGFRLAKYKTIPIAVGLPVEIHSLQDSKYDQKRGVVVEQLSTGAVVGKEQATFKVLIDDGNEILAVPEKNLRSVYLKQDIPSGDGPIEFNSFDYDGAISDAVQSMLIRCNFPKIKAVKVTFIQTRSLLIPEGPPPVYHQDGTDYLALLYVGGKDPQNIPTTLVKKRLPSEVEKNLFLRKPTWEPKFIPLRPDAQFKTSIEFTKACNQTFVIENKRTIHAAPIVTHEGKSQSGILRFSFVRDDDTPHPDIRIGFQLLTPDQQLFADSVRTNWISPGFTKPDIGGYTIELEDLNTLKPGEWLNDKCINAMLKLITLRSAASPQLPKTWCHNTFFYETLQKEGYDKVKRWTKNSERGCPGLIFSYDHIVVPVHLGDHWCCGLISFKRKRIEMYDSLTFTHMEFFGFMRRYLKLESLDKLGENFDLTGWKNFVCPAEKCPQQKNGYDCGMFTIAFAERLSREAPFDFSQEDMPYLRQRTMIELRDGTLFPHPTPSSKSTQPQLLGTSTQGGSGSSRPPFPQESTQGGGKSIVGTSEKTKFIFSAPARHEDYYDDNECARVVDTLTSARELCNEIERLTKTAVRREQLKYKIPMIGPFALEFKVGYDNERPFFNGFNKNGGVRSTEDVFEIAIRAGIDMIQAYGLKDIEYVTVGTQHSRQSQYPHQDGPDAYLAFLYYYGNPTLTPTLIRKLKSPKLLIKGWYESLSDGMGPKDLKEIEDNTQKIQILGFDTSCEKTLLIDNLRTVHETPENPKGHIIRFSFQRAPSVPHPDIVKSFTDKTQGSSKQFELPTSVGGLPQEVELYGEDHDIDENRLKFVAMERAKEWDASIMIEFTPHASRLCEDDNECPWAIEANGVINLDSARGVLPVYLLRALKYLVLSEAFRDFDDYRSQNLYMNRGDGALSDRSLRDMCIFALMSAAYLVHDEPKLADKITKILDTKPSWDSELYSNKNKIEIGQVTGIDLWGGKYATVLEKLFALYQILVGNDDETGALFQCARSFTFDGDNRLLVSAFLYGFDYEELVHDFREKFEHMLEVQICPNLTGRNVHEATLKIITTNRDEEFADKILKGGPRVVAMMGEGHVSGVRATLEKHGAKVILKSKGGSGSSRPPLSQESTQKGSRPQLLGKITQSNPQLQLPKESTQTDLQSKPQLPPKPNLQSKPGAGKTTGLLDLSVEERKPNIVVIGDDVGTGKPYGRGRQHDSKKLWNAIALQQEKLLREFGPKLAIALEFVRNQLYGYTNREGKKIIPQRPGRSQRRVRGRGQSLALASALNALEGGVDNYRNQVTSTVATNATKEDLRRLEKALRPTIRIVPTESNLVRKEGLIGQWENKSKMKLLRGERHFNVQDDEVLVILVGNVHAANIHGWMDEKNVGHTYIESAREFFGLEDYQEESHGVPSPRQGKQFLYDAEPGGNKPSSSSLPEVNSKGVTSIKAGLGKSKSGSVQMSTGGGGTAFDEVLPYKEAFAKPGGNKEWKEILETPEINVLADTLAKASEETRIEYLSTDANFSVQKQAQVIYQNDDGGTLLLGPRQIAQNENFREMLGITRILTIMDDDPFKSSTEKVDPFPDVQRAFLECSDTVNAQESMQNNLQIAVAIIDGWMKEKQTVYVHCSSGISRSSTLCIAYIFQNVEREKLLRESKYSISGTRLMAAYEFVWRRRPIILPNDGFMKALCWFTRLVQVPIRDSTNIDEVMNDYAMFEIVSMLNWSKIRLSDIQPLLLERKTAIQRDEIEQLGSDMQYKAERENWNSRKSGQEVFDQTLRNKILRYQKNPLGGSESTSEPTGPDELLYPLVEEPDLSLLDDMSPGQQQNELYQIEQRRIDEAIAASLASQKEYESLLNPEQEGIDEAIAASLASQKEYESRKDPEQEALKAAIAESLSFEESRNARIDRILEGMSSEQPVESDDFLRTKVSIPKALNRDAFRFLTQNEIQQIQQQLFENESEKAPKSNVPTRKPEQVRKAEIESRLIPYSQVMVMNQANLRAEMSKETAPYPKVIGHEKANRPWRVVGGVEPGDYDFNSNSRTWVINKTRRAERTRRDQAESRSPDKREAKPPEYPRSIEVKHISKGPSVTVKITDTTKTLIGLKNHIRKALNLSESAMQNIKLVHQAREIRTPEQLQRLLMSYNQEGGPGWIMFKITPPSVKPRKKSSSDSPPKSLDLVPLESSVLKPSKKDPSRKRHLTILCAEAGTDNLWKTIIKEEVVDEENITRLTEEVKNISFVTQNMPSGPNHIILEENCPFRPGYLADDVGFPDVIRALEPGTLAVMRENKFQRLRDIGISSLEELPLEMQYSILSKDFQKERSPAGAWTVYVKRDIDVSIKSGGVSDDKQLKKLEESTSKQGSKIEERLRAYEYEAPKPLPLTQPAMKSRPGSYVDSLQKLLKATLAGQASSIVERPKPTPEILEEPSPMILPYTTSQETPDVRKPVQPSQESRQRIAPFVIPKSRKPVQHSQESRPRIAPFVNPKSREPVQHSQESRPRIALLPSQGPPKSRKQSRQRIAPFVNPESREPVQPLQESRPRIALLPSQEPPKSRKQSRPRIALLPSQEPPKSRKQSRQRIAPFVNPK